MSAAGIVIAFCVIAFLFLADRKISERRLRHSLAAGHRQTGLVGRLSKSIESRPVKRGERRRRRFMKNRKSPRDYARETHAIPGSERTTDSNSSDESTKEQRERHAARDAAKGPPSDELGFLEDSSSTNSPLDKRDQDTVLNPPPRGEGLGERESRLDLTRPFVSRLGVSLMAENEKHDFLGSTRSSAKLNLLEMDQSDDRSRPFSRGFFGGFDDNQSSSWGF